MEKKSHRRQQRYSTEAGDGGGHTRSVLGPEAVAVKMEMQCCYSGLTDRELRQAAVAFLTRLPLYGWVSAVDNYLRETVLGTMTECDRRRFLNVPRLCRALKGLQRSATSSSRAPHSRLVIAGLVAHLASRNKDRNMARRESVTPRGPAAAILSTYYSVEANMLILDMIWVPEAGTCEPHRRQLYVWRFSTLRRHVSSNGIRSVKTTSTARLESCIL